MAEKVGVRARAIRRAGDLLKQITPGQGARDGKRADGADTPLTRTEAARQAGMSERQQVTAIRVANVPQDVFNTVVEDDKPVGRTPCRADFWIERGHLRFLFMDRPWRRLLAGSPVLSGRQGRIGGGLSKALPRTMMVLLPAASYSLDGATSAYSGTTKCGCPMGSEAAYLPLQIVRPRRAIRADSGSARLEFQEGHHGQA